MRCLRVMYVSAGKGSLPLSEVTLHISTNPRVTFSQHSVEEHIRLLMTVRVCSLYFLFVCLFVRVYVRVYVCVSVCIRKVYNFKILM